MVLSFSVYFFWRDEIVSKNHRKNLLVYQVLFWRIYKTKVPSEWNKQTKLNIIPWNFPFHRSVQMDMWKLIFKSIKVIEVEL